MASRVSSEIRTFHIVSMLSLQDSIYSGARLADKKLYSKIIFATVLLLLTLDSASHLAIGQSGSTSPPRTVRQLIQALFVGEGGQSNQILLGSFHIVASKRSFGAASRTLQAIGAHCIDMQMAPFRLTHCHATGSGISCKPVAIHSWQYDCIPITGTLYPTIITWIIASGVLDLSKACGGTGIQPECRDGIDPP